MWGDWAWLAQPSSIFLEQLQMSKSQFPPPITFARYLLSAEKSCTAGHVSHSGSPGIPSRDIPISRERHALLYLPAYVDRRGRQIHILEYNFANAPAHY